VIDIAMNYARFSASQVADDQNFVNVLFDIFFVVDVDLDPRRETR
jgi:hypothetical protein